MLEELKDYDWAEAFAYAGDPGDDDSWGGSYGSADIRTHPGSGVKNLDPFTREDVVKIYHLIRGYNDGPTWICVGKLKDGRFFVLEAGCDYTGWDCQAGGSAHVAKRLKDALAFGLDDNGRERVKAGKDAEYGDDYW